MPTAQAAKPVTYIVLDAGTGQILSEHDADSLNYPASLTKMMTLFLTFDALEHRRITLDSQFTVSRHAAVQAPSKLGLYPGSTISVHDLILAVVTHSANDAAVVLAEGLAGSEPEFAERMNREARFLGMSRTNFRNASGLPNRFQYTTARDLSKLALALYRTFPREYAYFSTESFTYRGETYGNHNHLMEAFQGMDGIKTGFINASGFNLAASAVRNNRRLVGVIMGGRTAQSRDMSMAELLDDAFARRSAVATMVASSDPTPHRVMPLRHAEGFSPISTAEAAVPVARVHQVAAEADDEEATAPPRHYRHTLRMSAVSRHSARHHHGIRTASARHQRHHGIMLASYERRATPSHASRHAGHRVRHAARHAERRVARARHRHVTARLAARRPVAAHRVAQLRHPHVGKARLVRAVTTHSHGMACGGWAGSNRPCPPALRGGHRATLRSASIRRVAIEPAG
ncbi:MAG TPA: D-alanyl-D-alanine carboxypeptidase family protein [Stellaceae bacterium]